MSTANPSQRLAFLLSAADPLLATTSIVVGFVGTLLGVEGGPEAAAAGTAARHAA